MVGLLPLALYAFGVQTKSKRDRERAEQAQIPVTFGQVDGEGPIVKFDPETHDGTTFANRFMKIGNSVVDIKDQQAKAKRQDLFAQRTSDGQYDPSFIGTMPEWNMAFANPQSPYYVSDDVERQKAPSTLNLIGQVDPNTNARTFVPGADFTPTAKEPKGVPIYKLFNSDTDPEKEGRQIDDFVTFNLSDAERRQQKYGGSIIPGLRFEQPDGTNIDQFKGSDITAAMSALKSVAKGTPVIQFDLAAGGDPIVGYAETGRDPREDLRAFDTTLQNTLGGTVNPQKIYELFNPDTYESSIRSLAGQIVEASTRVGQDGIPVYNLYLRTNADAFLKSTYPSIAKLPQMTNALKQASGMGEYEMLEFATAVNTQNGNSTRKGVVSVDNEGTEAVVAAPEPVQHTPGFDAFKTRLVDEGVDPQEIDNFLTESVTTYAGPDGLATGTLSSDQSKGKFIAQYLMGNRVGGKSDGRLFFDVFKDAIESPSNVYSPAEKTVIGKFVNEYGTSANYMGGPILASDEIDNKIQFMSMMNTDFDGATSAAFLYAQTYNKRESQFADFRQDQEIKTTAFTTAETYMAGFINTYRMPDGELIPYSSGMADFVIGLDGIVYAYDQFVKPAVSKFLTDNKQGAGKPVSGNQAITAMTESIGVKNPFENRFLSLSPEEQAVEAERLGQDVNVYRERELQAKEKIDSAWQATLEKAEIDSKGDKEMLYRLALRGYYRFMSAYALASAVQGGTGGRTISDQDVANFLKAFNSDRILADPALEERVLKHILSSVQAQKVISSRLASGGKDAISAMKLLSFPGANLKLTMGDLASSVGLAMSQVKAEDASAAAAKAEASRENNYGLGSAQELFDRRFERAKQYLEFQGKTVMSTNYEDLIAEHRLNEAWFLTYTDKEIISTLKRDRQTKQ